MFIHSRNVGFVRLQTSFNGYISCFTHAFSYDPNNLSMDFLTMLTIRMFNLLATIWLMLSGANEYDIVAAQSIKWNTREASIELNWAISMVNGPGAPKKSVKGNQVGFWHHSYQIALRA